MRFLLYNPNSNAALTAELADNAARSLPRGDTLISATPPGGPGFIGSVESIRQARLSLTELLPPMVADRAIDAVVLGCFGDLGIAALRRSIRRPVLSLWDACRMEASAGRRRLAILTTSAFWVARLEDDIRRHGLTGRFPLVRAIDAAPGASRAELVHACRAALPALAVPGGVEGVVLGGALLAVLGREVAAVDGFDIYDALEASFRVARRLAG